MNHCCLLRSQRKCINQYSLHRHVLVFLILILLYSIIFVLAHVFDIITCHYFMHSHTHFYMSNLFFYYMYFYIIYVGASNEPLGFCLSLHITLSYLFCINDHTHIFPPTFIAPLPPFSLPFLLHAPHFSTRPSINCGVQSLQPLNPSSLESLPQPVFLLFDICFTIAFCSCVVRSCLVGELEMKPVDTSKMRSEILTPYQK